MSARAPPSTSYDMFRGPTTRSSAPVMPPVDWARATHSTEWKVFNATAVMEAAAKRGPMPSPSLSEEEAKAWRRDHSVTVVGDTPCPPPMITFDALAPILPTALMDRVAAMGFSTPTPIQSQAWPVLLGGGDFVGIAKTGSGKTLAFGIPALAAIAALPYSPHPLALMLAPTRELAQQIDAELRKVTPPRVGVACVFGGGGTKGAQLAALRQRPNVLVATPGRLMDFVAMQKISLAHTVFVVLDEADRMLDMGFEPQVREIAKQLRVERQTVMFSATWPKEVQGLAASFMREFVRVHIGSMELLVNSDVKQHFLLVPENGRLAQLQKILAQHQHQRVLVFTKTKRAADMVQRQVQASGIRSMAIHGDKDQQQRDSTLQWFRNSPTATLIATDVAARGLDVKNLDVVINYDFPMQVDDYVHRVGRTGRAGQKGTSYTLLSLQEDQFAPQTAQTLVKMLQRSNQEVPSFITEHAQRTSVRRFGRPTAAMRGHPFHYKHAIRPTQGGFGGGTPRAPFGIGGGAPRAPFDLNGTGNSSHVRFRDEDDDGNTGRPHKVHRAEPRNL